ncbi:MAG TPA: cbb3-type cytochrome c oxidase subunit 3 [Ectothiorhodospiraceae bacterium]|nr:cbb3-type cytochrome c oxidase subunit 3 [Ectothiorhodospiraceae bacterium]
MGDYFQTDWAAMTVNDWVGLIMTVVVFFVMIWAYVYTFNPKNHDKLEDQRFIPFDDDENKDQFRNGEKK